MGRDKGSGVAYFVPHHHLLLLGEFQDIVIDAWQHVEMDDVQQHIIRSKQIDTDQLSSFAPNTCKVYCTEHCLSSCFHFFTHVTQTKTAVFTSAKFCGVSQSEGFKFEMRNTWFFDVNPDHGGALRLVQHRARPGGGSIGGSIIGLDSDIGLWKVTYAGNIEEELIADFHTKKNHSKRRYLRGRFHADPDRIEWEDGNVWYKSGVPPPTFLRAILNYTRF